MLPLLAISSECFFLFCIAETVYSKYSEGNYHPGQMGEGKGGLAVNVCSCVKNPTSSLAFWGVVYHHQLEVLYPRLFQFHQTEL